MNWPQRNTTQGSTNCGILQLRLGEQGISLENIDKMGNMENIEKIKNIIAMTQSTQSKTQNNLCHGTNIATDENHNIPRLENKIKIRELQGKRLVLAWFTTQEM